ncbi:MAG: FkbM family methyltransferase [Flavipsychrobacter sp.]|jgi:FkbM family methyltransferase|nr:FkbM family methyltransferase [Flavipsychrobacter sp.]
MAGKYHNELRQLTFAKKIISVLPPRARFRIAKALYNYESPGINGIDLVSPLQDDGLVCFINTKDLIGWKIFFFGEYEEGTNSILSKYIKPNDVVIEAGANIGSETLLIARMLKQGRVYAFEPNPYTFDRLKINASINELENISTYDYALGESDTTIQFNIYPKNFCNSGMSSKYMETSNTRKIDVTQKKLDTFLKENNINKVDFIKMDIQGAEMDMIAGATETIARHKPTIFTEACEPYNDTKVLYQTLKAAGYNVYLIGEKDTTLMNTPADIKDGNWLAINETKK